MLPPQHTTSRQAEVDPDEAIRQTDDDAAASRLSVCLSVRTSLLSLLPDTTPSFMVVNLSTDRNIHSSASTLGYLNDPFVNLLYKPPLGAGPSRKPPLLNVGTHHRTYAIDLLVDRFLEKGGRQVVGLGAGSDTRFWRLMVSPILIRDLIVRNADESYAVEGKTIRFELLCRA